MRIQPGSTIREWDFCEEIGRGAVGVIFRARHRLDGRDYAIKILRPELSKLDELKTRFLQEAAICARLEHPNIVKTLPAFEQAGRLFLPMELLEGNSLAALIALDDRPWPVDYIRFVVSQVTAALEEMATKAEAVVRYDQRIQALSHHFTNKRHALFLGRGIYYPIAMEGALKLKEISYIHAEAYPAGELKHGPLALVDNDMPVVAVAPDDRLMEKLRSNLEEVRARGGQLFVFASENAGYESGPGCEVLALPACSALAGPVMFTIALQLLAYHVAVARGTDVDKPRNLAKSVTVE